MRAKFRLDYDFHSPSQMGLPEDMGIWMYLYAAGGKESWVVNLIFAGVS